ncbi:MAG TPA: PAS domain S-box protein [Ktedonobacterales bacterium]|nr:PAS domain S-box protein [Ktedonobacterales bacterium]
MATLLLCAAFYVAAEIGLALHFPASLVYFVWPPSVVVFVALMLTPPRYWWMFALACLPVHMLTELGSVAAPLSSLLLFYGVVWVQALVGVWCVDHFTTRPLRLTTLRALSVLLLSGVAAALAEALTLVTILVLTDPRADFWPTFTQTMFAGTLSMVVLAPALVIAGNLVQRVWPAEGAPARSMRSSGRIWLTNTRDGLIAWLRARSVARVTEASLLALALLVIGVVAFGGCISLPGALPALLYTVLPLLLWSALRFGLGSTSLALCGLTLLSIVFAIHGRGPFTTGSATGDLFSLQLFFIAIAAPVLVLAVLEYERHAAQDGLEQSEARFRDLVESQTDMICRYLPDSTLTFVNEAYCRSHGRTREQLIGTAFLDLMDEPARAQHAQRIAALLGSTHPSFDEHETRLPDGSIGWLQWIDHTIRDAEGNVVEIQAVGRDVTSQRRAEEALHESEARFRAAFESAATGMMLVDTSGRPVQVNPPLMEMLGYSEEELLAHTFMDLTYPDDKEANMSLFHASMADEIDSYQLEKRLIHKQGHVVWAVVSAGVVRDALRHPLYVIGQVQDVTERKQAEEAQRASEERYRAVVTNFPRGVVLIFDDELRHVFADGQGLPDIGLSKDAVEGKTLWEVFPSGLSTALEPRYQAALIGEHAAFDLTCEGRIYQTQVSPIHYSGATAGMAIMQDVTEQRQAEVIAELDHAKSAFFNNVSHEFRTPLTLMLAPTAEALADRIAPLPPRQRERLELIQRGALRLHKLVDTLLEFSRIESGHIQPTYVPTDIAALTADLASMFRSAAERAGLRLIIDCTALDNLPQPVYMDRDMWEQIVLNLLSNALKFTNEGEITVTVRVTGDHGDQAQLEVRDTGVGIPPDDLPYIFERFYRAQNAHTLASEGTGIGLALVQELVRLHGGTVQVSSMLSKGSAFTVTIPVGAAHLPAAHVKRHEDARDVRARPIGISHAALFANEARLQLSDPPLTSLGSAVPLPGVAAWDGNAADAEPLAATATSTGATDIMGAGGARSASSAAFDGRATILVADDNPDLRTYLARLLSDRWNVLTVSDGRAALAAANAQPPDLILADVVMPELHGFTLVSALRAAPRTKALPIILLSARAGDEATVEGLQAGADDYLVKPFSARELLARVQTHLDLAQARKEAAARAAQLDAMFEAMADGVLAHDREGRLTRANRAYFDILRRQLELEHQHGDLDNLVAHPVERERFVTIREESGRVIPQQEWPTERALRGEMLTGTNAVDVFSWNEAGEVLQLNVSASPVRDSAGQITGAVAVYRDVTARRQLERRVVDQANQLEAVFNAMTDGVFVLDAHGGLTSLNPAGQRLFGLTRSADAASRPAARAAAIDLRDADGQPLAAVDLPSARLLRGEIIAGDTAQTLCLRDHDGSEHTVSLTGGPLRDTVSGAVVGAVGVFRDITALRQTQAALTDQERLFRTLVENSPDIISRFDSDLRHLYVSPSSEALTGIPAAARVGKTYTEIGLPEAAFAPWEAALRQVFTSGQTQTFETGYHVMGHSRRTSRVTYIPERAADGRVESVLGITTDITELKQAEEGLLAATAAAEAAQREEERRRHEAERREQIAESLRDVLTLLNSDRQVTNILDHITRQAGQLLSSDAAAIYMADSDVDQSKRVENWTAPRAVAGQDSLALQAAFGLPTALISSKGRRQLNIGTTAVRRAMAIRRPVAVVKPPTSTTSRRRTNQSQTDPLGPPERGKWASDVAPGSIEIREGALPAPYHALLAIPIVAQGRAYGSLLLLYAAPRRFTTDEVALAAAYSDQIALAVANAHLQDHIGRAAAEAERNRLARELHDTVTQEIFTASMVAEAIPRVWGQHQDAAEAQLEHLHQLTRSALAGLRALLLELRPAVLEKKTLADLLDQLREVMAIRTHAPIALAISGDCPPMPMPVKITFYRIAQEALMNAIKYANARNITVRLRYRQADEAIQLDIQDDGQGFEAGATPAGHFGIGMMRERARAVGATLRITSQRQRGTHIALKWREKGEDSPAGRTYATTGRARRGAER